MTFAIRPAAAEDRAAIFAVEAAAFGRDDEAELAARLVADGAAVLELVAERDGAIVGHVLFTRLGIDGAGGRFAAVALAPLAVSPRVQGEGVGRALVEEAHARLRAAGETLSVVLGDPAYYGRFGYAHRRAERFVSDFQGDALQALAWGEAPLTGRLDYPRAFGAS